MKRQNPSLAKSAKKNSIKIFSRPFASLTQVAKDAEESRLTAFFLCVSNLDVYGGSNPMGCLAKLQRTDVRSLQFADA